MTEEEGSAVLFAPPYSRLSQDEIHIWVTSPNVPDTSTWERTLDPDERARAARFRHDLHRCRFVVARGTLRIILARYLRSEPADLRFSYNVYGKPFLVEGLGPSPLRFNLSHAEDLCVYAVAWDREVGIDIELVRDDLPLDRLAERFFGLAELANLRALPEESRQEAFFRTWTRREAHLKGRGVGLSRGVGILEEDPRWRVKELSMPAGYVGAVAAEGAGWRLRSCRLSSEVNS